MENRTETIVIHLEEPTAFGTTENHIKAKLSPVSLAGISSYINKPQRKFSSNNENSVSQAYYVISVYDEWGHRDRVKELALSGILGWLDVERVQQSLAGTLAIPDEVVSKAVAKAEEYAKTKEQKRKANEAARIEKQKTEAAKKEQEKQAAEKLAAEKLAAREVLADELSEMRKKQAILTRDVKYWREKAEKTEQQTRDAVVEEIIDDGYIDVDEDVEVRYSVEKE